MSIKVYTGFKVPEQYIKDFDSLSKWMSMVSDESQRFMSQKYYYQMARNICLNLLDWYGWKQKFYDSIPRDLYVTLNMELNKYYPKEKVEDRYKSPDDVTYDVIKEGVTEFLTAQQQEVDYTHMRNPGYDFKPAISLASFENKIYGIVIDEHGLFNHLIEMGYIEDYYYQNQTDPDENLSEEEWNERERVWDAIDYFTFKVFIDYSHIKYGQIYYYETDGFKCLADCIKEVQNEMKESYIREAIIVKLSQYLIDNDTETNEEEKKLPHYSFKQFRLIETAYDGKGNDKDLIQKVEEQKLEYNKIFDNFDIYEYINNYYNRKN